MQVNTLRAASWILGTATGASMFGLQWATQTLDTPVWALLVLTFVPTSELIATLLTFLQAAQYRVTPDGMNRD